MITGLKKNKKYMLVLRYIIFNFVANIFSLPCVNNPLYVSILGAIRHDYIELELLRSQANVGNNQSRAY